MAKVVDSIKSVTKPTEDASKKVSKLGTQFSDTGRKITGSISAIKASVKSIETIGWEKTIGLPAWKKLPLSVKAASLSIASFKSSARIFKDAIGGISTGLDNINKKMEQFENLASVGQTISGVGQRILRSFTGSVLGNNKDQAQITDIAITGDLNANQTAQLGTDARNIAKKRGVKTGNVLDVIGLWTAQSGSVEDAKTAADPLIVGAKATGAAYDEMARAGYASLNGLKIATNQLSDAQDVMIYNSKKGGFEYKSMAQYLPGMMGTAESLGIQGVRGASTISSALQVVQQKGQDPGEAANNLQNLMGAIRGPELSKRFKDVAKIDLRKELDAGRKQGKDDLETFLNILSPLVAKNPNAYADLLGDVQARKAAMELVSGQNKFKSIRDDGLKNSKGTAEKDAARRGGDFGASMDRLGAAGDRINNAFGKAITPMLEPLARILESIASGMEKVADSPFGTFLATLVAIIGLVLSAIGGLLSGIVTVGGAWLTWKLMGGTILKMLIGMLDGIIGFGAGIASFASGVMRFIPMVISAFRMLGMAVMANPIIAVIAIVAMLAVAIIMNWSKIKPYFAKFWAWLKNIAANVWHSIASTVSNVVGKIKAVWDGVKGWFSGVWDAIKNAAKSAMDAILGWVAGPVKLIGDLIQKVGQLGSMNLPKMETAGGGGNSIGPYAPQYRGGYNSSVNQHNYVTIHGSKNPGKDANNAIPRPPKGGGDFGD